MPPPDAKRMASGVGVHLIALLGAETRRRLQQTCSVLDCPFVGTLRILDVNVHVDLLLRGTVRPLGWSVLWGVLYANDPRATHIDHAMELFVISHDMAVKHCGPEGALASDVCCVKHDDVSNQFHAKTVAVRGFITNPFACSSIPPRHSGAVWHQHLAGNYRSATCQGTIRSALISRLAGAVRRCNRAYL